MARLAISAAAGASSASPVALEEAITVFTAALAALVAQGASPTQGAVTTTNNAWTTVSNMLAGNFIVYYDRSTITTQELVRQAIAAVQAQTRCIT